MIIEEVSIKVLIPYGDNPRKYGPREIEQFAAAIREFGFRVPVLTLRDGRLIDGYFRLAAATAAGMDRVPAVYVDGWPEEKIRAFRLAINRMADLATWDEDKLAAELKALSEQSLQLTKVFLASAVAAAWCCSRSFRPLVTRAATTACGVTPRSGGMSIVIWNCQYSFSWVSLQARRSSLTGAKILPSWQVLRLRPTSPTCGFATTTATSSRSGTKAGAQNPILTASLQDQRPRFTRGLTHTLRGGSIFKADPGSVFDAD